MKKYLIVFAAALVALASCGPQESSEYTKIAFKEKSIDLAVGDSKKLNVLYEPTTIAEAPVCEWSSSNPEVATVDANGRVEALAIGQTNITAKHGELEAVCQVNVKSVYSMYSIEDYGVFGSAPDSIVAGSDTTFTLSWAGGSFNCVLAYWPVLAWDGDLTYVSGSGFQGAGYLLYSYVPFYTINDESAGDYNGTPFGWGSFRFAETDGQAIRNIGEAGKVDRDKYCEYMDSYITELMKETPDGSNIKWDLFNEAISGAMIFGADYTTDDPTWYIDYGLVSALVKDMTLIWDGETETFSYVADIDWFENGEGVYYGLKYNEEGVVKPYDLSLVSEHYELDYANLAPKSTEPQQLKHYNEMPQMPKAGNKVAADKLIKK